MTELPPDPPDRPEGTEEEDEPVTFGEAVRLTLHEQMAADVLPSLPGCRCRCGQSVT